MVKKILLYIFILSSISFSSCKLIYSSRMLETPSDFKFDTLPKFDAKDEFKLAVNDVFQFKLFSNDGFKLVDMNINTSSQGQGQGMQINYIINPDGTSKLPLINLVNLSGLTIKQAEDTLEKMYSEYYIKPFILLTVTSRKIIFFGNGEGSAKIIPLQGSSISLIEAIASAGGIPTSSKAYSVKILRGESSKPIVYKVDLSTLEGYKKGNIILQSNDIVYIDARPRYVRGLTQEFAPFITIFTSLLVTFRVYNTFSRI